MTDAERLDWLDATEHFVMMQQSSAPFSSDRWSVAVSEKNNARSAIFTYPAPTFREALDKAIQNHPLAAPAALDTERSRAEQRGPNQEGSHG